MPLKNGISQTDHKAGSGYITTTKTPVLTKKLHQQIIPQIFGERTTKSHDCRCEFLRTRDPISDAEHRMLSKNLNLTFQGLHQLWTPRTKKRKNQFICKIGTRGSGQLQFNYPRGVTITSLGDIVVADSENHRIQVLTQCGLFKNKFGSYGTDPGEFNEPSGVAAMTNGHLMIADRRNRRIQIMDKNGHFLQQFYTRNQPYAIAVDTDNDIVVGTVKKTVEVYENFGLPSYEFYYGTPSKQKTPVQICINKKKQIIISDSTKGTVKIFSFDGKTINTFHPTCGSRKLFTTPSGVSLTPMDCILVADSLNHTISTYFENGTLIHQLLGPLNGVGNVQACCLGMEGHLVMAEYSITGDHCLRLSRYRPCHCHIREVIRV